MNTSQKLKIYLDTTVPNFLYTDDRLDWMEHTWRLWGRCMAGEYEIYVSWVLFDEIDVCPEPKRSKMFEKLGSLKLIILKETAKIRELAAEYIKRGVLKEKDSNDCLHIACAVAYGCDFLLSWNFHHTSDKTKGRVKVVNANNRYRGIEIVSPDEFLDGGNNGSL